MNYDSESYIKYLKEELEIKNAEIKRLRQVVSNQSQQINRLREKEDKRWY